MARPKPKPKPKPRAKPKPKPGVARPPVSAPAEADHSTLDVAGMSAAGSTGTPETDVTTEGGPGQDDAVFSTGPGQASSLHYHQKTTYQQVYADQVAESSQTEGTQ